MIVCMCNRLNDAKVRAAIQAGAKTPAEVFKLLRVQRACGQCIESISTMLDEAKAEGKSASA
jgi:bacterioferritin-associated ferredoxin